MGVYAAVLDAIMAYGLKPMQRQHLHLSADVDTARTVGARRGRPIVVAVDAGAMQRDGARFWQASNGVWLFDLWLCVGGGWGTTEAASSRHDVGG